MRGCGDVMKGARVHMYVSILDAWVSRFVREYMAGYEFVVGICA